MGLFSRGPSAQDMEEAKNILKKLRPGVDKIVDRFDPVCKGPVEFTMLLTFSYFYFPKAPKNFSACVARALVESFKYWEKKGSDQAEAGVVSIFLGKISDTFQDAYKKGLNPVEAVFDSFFRENLLRNRTFTENPYFLIDAKRAINDLIEKQGLTGLYPYKFAAGELLMPTPRVFINLNKAKTIQLEKKDGGYTDFYVAQIIEKDHSTYLCLMEHEKDTPFIVKAINNPNGSLGIEFISNEKFHELYQIYAKNYSLFSAYDSPAY